MAFIFQINTSNGGVPKHGMPVGEVAIAGIEGDHHRDLEHHGGPDRALCLYSLERILALQEEGHPVFPGAMGENITISGLDWSQVIPGSRLHLGETVVLELTSYTVPCNNLKPFFKNEEIKRVGQKQNPGWSRLYARVIQEGTIQVGDRVSFS
jgi:MOSC domain-containing protein YiiM